LANIGRQERTARRWMGISLLALGTALTWVLGSRGEPVPSYWAVLFLVLYVVAVRLVLDAQTGTCPLKAERGEQELDGWLSLTGRPIGDPRVEDLLRHVSRRAWVFAVVAGVVLGSVSMWTATG